MHYHDRFNQPSINGGTGCTNIFAIISNAELNILVCMSLHTCEIYSEIRHGMVGLLGMPVFKLNKY